MRLQKAKAKRQDFAGDDLHALPLSAQGSHPRRAAWRALSIRNGYHIGCSPAFASSRPYFLTSASFALDSFPSSVRTVFCLYDRSLYLPATHLRLPLSSKCTGEVCWSLGDCGELTDNPLFNVALLGALLPLWLQLTSAIISREKENAR